MSCSGHRGIHLIVVSLIFSALAAAQGIIVESHPGQSGSGRRGAPWQPVRIAKHHVDVKIDGRAAKTTLSQTFRNDSRSELEGTYLFPIDDNASITEFTMVMNGQVVKGEVVEKDKARSIYEGIVRQRRDPALLEYAGSRLFKARVFPIPAMGNVDVTLTYVEQVRSDAGTFEYRYPLKTRAYDQSPVESIAVRATIVSSSAIRSVFSSSHQIEKVQKGDGDVVVSFEGKAVDAAADFQLYWSVSDQDFGMNLLSDTVARDDTGYFMLTLSPKQHYSTEEIVARDIVFVLDTSGSMRENKKFEQAIQALEYGVSTLRADDRFNVIAFSTEARTFADKLLPVNDATKKEALTFIRGLSANGGTNIHDALDLANRSLGAPSERVSMMVFLTDGTPTVGETNSERILANATNGNGGRSRLFVFGVGYDVNVNLLDRLAETNRGTRDYVTPSQNIEVVLSSFFDKVSSPVLADCKVMIDGLEVQEVYPKVLPELFKGTEITLFGRYRGSGMKSIRLAGNVNGKSKEYVFEGRFTDQKTDRDFIAVLWAKRKVGYLLDQIRLNGANAELESEVVRLAKKFGIATPYTSFLVVEDEPTASRPPRPGRHAPGSGGGGFRGGATPERKREDRGSPSGGSTGGGDGGPTGGGPGSSGAPPREAFDAGAPVPDPSAPAAKAAEVELSRSINLLKDSNVGADSDVKKLGEAAKNGGKSKKSIERVGDKSFEDRDGVWIDLDVDKLAAESKPSETVIEAFSEAYFKLIADDKELARIAARFERFVLYWKGKIYRFVPAPEVSSGGD